MPTDPPEAGYFRALFDAIPSPILIVDRDVRIEDANAAGFRFLDASGDPFYRRKGGDALHCLQAMKSPEGCGHAPACPDCVIRRSVGLAFEGESVTRARMRMQVERGGDASEVNLLVTAAPFAWKGRSLVLLHLEDINELVSLKALLPICSWCRKIRTGKRYWLTVEEYLREHADIDFSHSICEDCLRKELRDLGKG
jgi:hypothetical protein